MTKLMLVKTDKGWVGGTADDEAEYRKLQRRMKAAKPGKWLRMDASSPRHGKHHRKFFALLNLIVENSETYDTIRKALTAVKLVVGHFDLVVDPSTGEITKQVNSISYESMEQEEFDKFYGEAIDGVLQHILKGMDKNTAEQLMEHIVEGWIAR